VVAGHAGPLVAGVLALVLAFGAFGIRNGIARRLIAARELRAERARLLEEARAKRAREEAEEDQRREAAMKASMPAPKTAETCLEAFRAQAPPAHPEVPKILETIFLHLDREHATHVPLVWRRTETSATAGPISEEQWASVEKVVGETFGRVLSETCPANVMRFGPDLAAVGHPDLNWGLFVEYTVSWPKTFSVRRRGAPGETMSVMGLHVVFDVKLVAPDRAKTAKFRLTMPPPDKLAMARRPQSIFPSSLEDDGTYDERVYESMTARAFDRLYDEIWSLFFSGNPKVPESPK
jgi:hypothetical protein